ncbi:hypothetical protein AGMMS49992_12440 [Clostridia bacterium]|nr:hypothetical protein AGMMS49992_12440 [Clostridia bacterium]
MATTPIDTELGIIKDSVLSVVPNAEAIYLFGSYAYGVPHKDSDIDIYVVIPDSIIKNPIYVGVDIRRAIPDSVQYPLDILVGRSSVFERRRHSCTLQREIAEKGIQLL